MNVHISIPELDERNLTTEEFFRVVYVMLVHEMKYLMEIHPSEAINNIEDYPLQLAKRIVESAHTLYYVIEMQKDYVVAFTIVRSIADMLSTFILIYGGDDIEEKSLRHYLYILDGMQGRLSLLPDGLVNDGRLKDEEYDCLSNQIQSARLNYSLAVALCKREIQRLAVYKEEPEFIDKLIKKRNWKFKKKELPKDCYKWNEMYDFIEIKLDGHFISSLSDFVHGLSTSLLVVELDTTTFEPVYGVSISLLGKLREQLEKLYTVDMPRVRENMLSALLDKAMPKHYVEYILEQANAELMKSK